MAYTIVVNGETFEAATQRGARRKVSNHYTRVAGSGVRTELKGSIVYVVHGCGTQLATGVLHAPATDNT